MTIEEVATTERELRYLRDQLPVVMSEDRRLDVFLAPFDQIAGELYEFIAAKEHLFDLTIAPLGMVRYLAHHLGVDIESDLDESVQRRQALAAARTFLWRGTKASIETNVAAVTGCGVRIVDGGEVTVSAFPDVADPETRRRTSSVTLQEDAAGTADDLGRTEVVVRVLLESYGDAPVASVKSAIERELSCTTRYRIEITEEWPP